MASPPCRGEPEELIQKIIRLLYGYIYVSPELQYILYSLSGEITNTHTHVGTPARTHTYMQKVHTCGHASMLAYLGLPAYLHTFTCIHAYGHTFLHSCQHARIHACPHTHMHAYTHAHTIMHACIHTYIHTYIHTHIHTYIHTLYSYTMKLVFLQEGVHFRSHAPSTFIFASTLHKSISPLVQLDYK